MLIKIKLITALAAISLMLIFLGLFLALGIKEETDDSSYD